jgi:2-polyprenyl-6-methoxyphenol hydroxylase-like FAD-dependent oxidoreductase
MPAVNRVLIIGGGIAGLTLAIALRRKGIHSEVAEISGAPVGTTIGLTGRAPMALAELAVLDQCARAGRAISLDFLTNQRDSTGQPLHVKGVPELPSGWRGRAIVKVLQWMRRLPPGPGGIFIYRPTLASILSEEASRLGAIIRIPWSVKTLRNSPEKVEAEFEGGETASYDLVVGADGVHSTVRELVFGDVVKPQFTGLVSLRWMSFGPHAEGPAGFHNAGSIFVAIGELPGMTYVASGFEAAENRRVSPEEARSILRSNLEAFTAPKIVELRNRITDDADIICRPFETLLVPNPWYRGRVLLIGDAAHATTAHLSSGGGMAIEDAVVLAQTLANTSSLPNALSEFMRRRFERARAVVETSVKIGELMQSGAPMRDVQQLRMRATRVLAQPY